MSQMIAYNDRDGSLVLTVPVLEGDMTLAEVAHAVVPTGTTYIVIDSSALPESGDYREAWTIDATDPDNPVIVEDAAKKAEIIKQRALADLEDWFREMTTPGFATADGWRIGMSQDDVILLTGNYVLAKESAALGGPIPPVIDMDGVSHEIANIEELTAIMLAYGQRRAEISAEYAAKRAAIVGGA